MPHMKFKGTLDIEALWRKPPAFRFSVPEEDLHFKFTEAFLGGKERVLMLRFVVAEGRLTQYVQVVLASGVDEWVLKLDRAYPILRTAGIKLLLATLGAWLEQRGLVATFSTIKAYEERGRFYAAHQTSD
jgi:hypothetical protein